MFRLIILAISQSLMLSVGQTVLKIALERMPSFGWTMKFWGSLLTNWWFAASGLLFGGASILWLYILRHFPLSVAYPLASLSYVFAMILAAIVFHETLTWGRILGVLLIMAGCVFVVGSN